MTRLAVLLKEQRISQRELARRTGLSQGSVARACHGELVSERTARGIALRLAAMTETRQATDVFVELFSSSTVEVNRLTEEKGWVAR